MEMATTDAVLQFMIGLDTFFQLSSSFCDLQGAERERILESAEQNLQDVVFLEPVLPDGGSIVRAINDVVCFMRHECEALQAPQDCQLAHRSRGRPRCDLSKEQLLFLLEHGFSQTAMGTMLGCSTRTIRRRITEFNLEPFLAFSDVDNEVLDLMVEDIQKQYPNWGEKSVQGHLNSVGLNIQRWRIRESLRRVCPSAVREQFRCAIHHRRYNVPHPSSLWHIDGYHKLIR